MIVWVLESLEVSAVVGAAVLVLGLPDGDETASGDGKSKISRRSWKEGEVLLDDMVEGRIECEKAT